MLDLFTLMTTMGLQNELADKDETRVIHPDEETLEPPPTQPSLVSEFANSISGGLQNFENAVVTAANNVSQSEEVAALSGFVDDMLHGGTDENSGGNPFVLDLTLPPPPIKLMGGKTAKKA